MTTSDDEGYWKIRRKGLPWYHGSQIHRSLNSILSSSSSSLIIIIDQIYSLWSSSQDNPLHHHNDDNADQMHRLLSSSRLHLAWEDPLAQLILDWVHLKQERLPSLVIIFAIFVFFCSDPNDDIQGGMMDLLQVECLSGLEEAQMLARHPTVQVISYDCVQYDIIWHHMIQYMWYFSERLACFADSGKRGGLPSAGIWGQDWLLAGGWNCDDNCH